MILHYESAWKREKSFIRDLSLSSALVTSVTLVQEHWQYKLKIMQAVGVLKIYPESESRENWSERAVTPIQVDEIPEKWLNNLRVFDVRYSVCMHLDFI